MSEFKICPYCQKSFPIRAKHEIEFRKYCSRQCACAALKKPRVSVICKACGREFKVKASPSKMERVKYCSKNCRYTKGKKIYPIKECTQCHQTKSLDSFFRDPQTIDKHQSVCKECMKAKVRQSRRKDKRKWATYSFRSRLKHLYGVNEEMFNTLLDKQQGRCAICGGTQVNGFGKRLAIDHDAKTKKIRGLLCGNCNRGIGSFQHNKRFLENAIIYLEKNT